MFFKKYCFPECYVQLPSHLLICRIVGGGGRRGGGGVVEYEYQYQPVRQFTWAKQRDKCPLCCLTCVGPALVNKSLCPADMILFHSNGNKALHFITISHQILHSVIPSEYFIYHLKICF